ncbi:hypothetical protein D918_00169 [Trichuris suis]|nr:hypothetical protein D918_00169 [Trichuris suis]
MSCSNAPTETSKDLISFDDSPVLPTSEMAQSTSEPLSLIDAWLSQSSETVMPSSDASKAQVSHEQADLKEVINLLRLMSRFATHLTMDKIIATIDVLAGKRCMKAVLIEALQQLGALEYMTDESTVSLKRMRPDKYVEKGYLVMSVKDYVRYPVSTFDDFMQSGGEKVVLMYNMELLSFSKPDDFVIRRSDVSAKEMDYLKQVDSVCWFPAGKLLKADLPCLISEQPGGNLRRAIFRSFCPNGKGLFYLVDFEKTIVAKCRHALLIPERIFRCYVDAYRVRLAFVRPLYGNLWSKAVVETVRQCVNKKPFQVSFVQLEDDVKSVVLFNTEKPLFEELLDVPLAVFDLTELINYANLEALELLLSNSVRPLKKLQEMYLDNPGYFDVFESCYEHELEEMSYDKHGQLTVDSSLLVQCVEHLRHYFVGAFKDVSCKLSDKWYYECLKSERRLKAICECFDQEHLTMDDNTALCYLDDNIQLLGDDSLLSQFNSLSLTSTRSSRNSAT